MVNVQDVYYPMYQNKDKFIILITGGRGSAKSYNSSTFIERLTFELNKYIDDDGEVHKIVHNILYTRYTMSSASISVIPEFMEKIEADGTQQYFSATRTDVTNTLTGSTIMFRGIKTSSGNQTAKLKSIHGITTFVCDEAEEWTSEKEFDTIMLSIRTKGIQNRIIIIMNPTDSNHFIYQKYIKDTHKIVEYDGVPVQISTHPNVLHIHTSYLDNREHLSEEFIKEVELMKENNPEKYAHIVMGRWSDVAEGAIFKKWGIVDSFPAECRHVARGLDLGYSNDVSACVKVGVFNNDLYIDELFYKTHMGTAELIKELKKEDTAVYSESADPRMVDEIAMSGVLIYPVDKSGNSILAGIQGLQDYDNIFVTKRSYNVQEELRNYTWDKDKNDNWLNVPIDRYNHACFVGETLITTDKGQVRIDQIKAGDKVLTSQGYKRVLNVFDNGIKQVDRKCFKFNNKEITITATADHLFKANKSWKRNQDLTKGDKLYTTLSSMAKGITDITQNTIEHPMEQVSLNCCYILRFIKCTMAIFLLGMLYIILTVILLITTPIILLLYLVQTTCEHMINSESTAKSTQTTLKDCNSQAKTGMKKCKSIKKKSKILSILANGAEKIFIRISSVLNSVLLLATNNGNYTQSATKKSAFAWCAERLLRQVSALITQHVQKSVPISEKVQEEELEGVLVEETFNEQVYDLEVEDVHEYFANGVLVHNCDATRYWYLGKMLGKILRKKENGKVNNNISNFGF